MIQRYDWKNLSGWDETKKGKWCKYEDVDKLEEQNKQLLDALVNYYKEHTCQDCTELLELNDCPLSKCDCMIFKTIIENITGKKPEEL
jgi:hypothetical protein